MADNLDMYLNGFKDGKKESKKEIEELKKMILDMIPSGTLGHERIIEIQNKKWDLEDELNEN